MSHFSDGCGRMRGRVARKTGGGEAAFCFFRALAWLAFTPCPIRSPCTPAFSSLKRT